MMCLRSPSLPYFSPEQSHLSRQERAYIELPFLIIAVALLGEIRMELIAYSCMAQKLLVNEEPDPA